MLNSRSIRIVKKYIYYLGLLGSIPFSWDERRQNIRNEKSLFWFFVSVSQALFYLIFLLFRFEELLRNPSSSFPQGSWLFFWINIYFWSLVAFANGYMRKWEAISLFKGIRKLTDDLSKDNHGAKMPELAFKSNILDICYVACLLVELLYILSTTVMFIAIPHHPQYLYSLITDTRAGVNYKSWEFWCFLLLEVYSKACSAFSNGGLGISLFPGMLISTFWLKYARLRVTQLERKLKIFRLNEIMMRYYNYSLIWLVTPVSLLWLPCSTGVSSAFACIRYHSFLSFFEYIPFPVALFNAFVVAVVTLVPSGEVFENSNSLLVQMSTATEVKDVRHSYKIVRRQMKSLQPFGVKLGVIQGVRKILVLTTFSLISDNIFNLLVTFPQEVVTN